MNIDEKEFEEVKRLGSSKYLVSKDRELFVKISDNKEALKEEYEALKKMNKKDPVEGLDFVEPIKVEDNKLITKYIEGTENLIETLDPDLFRKFGERLKEFHEAGYTLGGSQINDVLYKNQKFTITDLGKNLGKKTPEYDIATFKESLEVKKIKKPWKSFLYNNCFKSFLKGYGEMEKKKFEKVYHKKFNRLMNNFNERGKIGKIKAIIMKFLRIIGFIGVWKTREFLDYKKLYSNPYFPINI